MIHRHLFLTRRSFFDLAAACAEDTGTGALADDALSTAASVWLKQVWLKRSKLHEAFFFFRLYLYIYNIF